MLAEFRSEEGQVKMWDMIVQKTVKAFDLIGYYHYLKFCYNENIYDIIIESNLKYKFKVLINEKINITMLNIDLHYSKGYDFEYIAGELYLL